MSDADLAGCNQILLEEGAGYRWTILLCNACSGLVIDPECFPCLLPTVCALGKAPAVLSANIRQEYIERCVHLWFISKCFQATLEQQKQHQVTVHLVS